MSSGIEFITKQIVKATDPFVSITTSGSNLHKQVRFTFRNNIGQKISKTGYIVVSNIDEESENIYFKESTKNEGYILKTNKTTENGSISINADWLAKKLEEFEWIGDYPKVYKEDGYYCIHKIDCLPIPKKKR